MPEDLQGQRLRYALSSISMGKLSKAKIRQLCKQNEIRLNGRVCSSDTSVRAGDIIWAECTAPSKPRYEADLSVLFEDEHVLAIDKPAGWITSGNGFRTVENTLPMLSETVGDQLVRPQPVHRLDAATSGILLFAKTRSARLHLYNCFANQTIEKQYLAVVRGFTPLKTVLNYSLDGKKAKTTLKTLQRIPSVRFGYLSRLKLQIASGRTHQIRRHLRIHGNPVLGDTIYDTLNSYPGKGLFLHATSIRFPNLDGRCQTILSPEPSKFHNFCSREYQQWQRSTQ